MTATHWVMAAAALMGWAAPLTSQTPPEPAQTETGSPIAFSFAPPIGSTLRYEQTRTSTLNGAMTGARLTYDYRFERYGEGYLLWVELIGVEGMGEERRARLAETVAAPMLDLAYAVELSADGAPHTIRNEDRVWERTLDGIALIEDDMRTRTNIGEEERAQMLALLAATRNQEGEARTNGMLIAVSDMLALAGRTITADTHPVDIEIASPFGGTIALNGTMAAEMIGEDRASIAIEGHAETPDGFTVRDRSRYRGAPSSGLVHHMERNRAFVPPDTPDAPDYSEHITVHLIAEIPAEGAAETDAH